MTERISGCVTLSTNDGYHLNKETEEKIKSIRECRNKTTDKSFLEVHHISSERDTTVEYSNTTKTRNPVIRKRYKKVKGVV